MNRIFELLKDARVISAIGLALALAVIYLIASTFDVEQSWIFGIMAAAALVWFVSWSVRRKRSQAASGAMAQMFQNHAAEAVKAAPADKKHDVEILRKRLVDAVQKIKTSKLGQTSGSTALYELPWYIVIGNPAAGKSTAIVNSGLNFPFSEKSDQAIQGVGGTRNCDWFFTTEGILLDTAGRYAVHEEDRSEWFGFLNLLKKYRPKAPINGIVIVASIAELTGNRPEATITLAKQLRQRVQELTERLELFAPVYIMFTKVDLIAGFVDFFEDSDAEERSRVWGTTLPYDAERNAGAASANAVALFEQHFDTLADGVKELGSTRMSINRGQSISPGVLTFPMEFIGIKQHLSTFIATLFEDNPFQFKPIFRGFYFTSAIQEGVAAHATGQRIVQQFGLSAGRRLTASVSSSTGFFLKNLFSSVIFADRNLVRQYASRNKLLLRKVAFFSAVLTLGLLLGGWSWSYVTNRQYVANVQADLEKAVKIQQSSFDLASRLEALEVLQDRLEQLRRYRADKPLALAFGLYQGGRLEHKLRTEYFAGLRQVMLEPVGANLESFLAEVGANAARLESAARVPQSAVSAGAVIRTGGAPSPYKELSPANPDDAYNALKTYLMLAQRDRVDASHLGDQVTRFWRNWLDTNRGNASREQVIRSAEKLISFYLSQAREPDFPLIETKLALVEQSRETLRTVVKGTPARERVYSEIKMRASTRFPAIAVAGIVGDQNKEILAGSYAIPGAFTRAAWDEFIEGAIKEASTQQLQSADWILKTSVRDDLSLEGSPEQIQRDLARMYKTEYASEWKKFMQGVTVTEFNSFDAAVTAMDRLGDPVASPLHSLMQTVYRETSWDNPSLVNQGLQGARRSIAQWFRATILRQAPQQVNINLSAARSDERQMGAVGKDFAAIANLVVTRGENKDASLLNGYLAQLSRVRTRFNQIRNSGDIGPASRQLMQATLDGSGSELADALKYVDESMLTGVPDAERAAIRPLLVRPLMQAFAAIVPPAEQELNRTWNAQVYEPFGRSLATKYPFASESRVEATSTEIAQVFGPDGAIAKFVQTSMGPLVVRRGDTLAARTWADMGIRLNPAFSDNLARFVAMQGSGASAQPGAGQAQTAFQLRPLPTPGLVEYSIEIDGQTMRYRNGQQDWFNFVWPSPLGQPGAKITALAADGRNIVIADFPGQFGLEKLINSAQRTRMDNGMFAMTWDGNEAKVGVNFRLISDSRNTASTGAGSDGGLRGLQLPATVVGAEG